MKNIFKGNIVDAFQNKIYYGEIEVENGIITSILPKEGKSEVFILPGFIDAHVHIESSMLSPARFGIEAAKHGTVAILTDPHEISNVLGVKGFNYMVESAKSSPIKTFFGVPSCVPATTFETSGSSFDSKIIEQLLDYPEVYFLSEMMNFPGVIFDDPAVHEKLKIARLKNKPIDGHAPGLSGKDLAKYISTGISTDHECFTLNEALEKLKLGMKIQIREGSAAKNYNSLKTLITTHNTDVMICTDDSHPDDLQIGHINRIASKAIKDGFSIFDVIRATSTNAIKHYQIPVGRLQVNDPADFIIVKDLQSFEIVDTIINGSSAINKTIDSVNNSLNNFHAAPISQEDIIISTTGDKFNLISIIDGELITNRKIVPITTELNRYGYDLTNDYLKIVVLNRYIPHAKPAIGYINGFGLKKGAIASCIAHDSHNIIAIGSNEDDLVKAINTIIEKQGGICTVSGNKILSLELEIGGIITDKPIEMVAESYSEIQNFIKNQLGCMLNSPLMTLSFMALLVIPELKLGDKGLFDIRDLSFVELFE